MTTRARSGVVLTRAARTCGNSDWAKAGPPANSMQTSAVKRASTARLRGADTAELNNRLGLPM